MKKEKTKVTKKAPKMVLNYKELYESMRDLADTVSDEMFAQARAFDNEVNSLRSKNVIWSIGSLLVGIAIGLLF